MQTFLHFFCRSKAKSPPQDALLKLEKESSYKEEAEGSSHFVFKLGLSRLECCLLMNGLVYEASEVSHHVSKMDLEMNDAIVSICSYNIN